MPLIGVAPYNQISIVNKSAIMKDAEGQVIVNTLNNLLPIFCKDWCIPAIKSIYVKKGAKPTTPLVVNILDTPDALDALGYHDMSADTPYANVFVSPVVSNGGAILAGKDLTAPTVAQTVSHEVFEMIVDLRCNTWWMGADNSTLYAAEVADPVQNNAVVVKFGSATVVHSDWILPAWSDPQATKGPYNHLNTLTGPFTMSPGGYLITLTTGQVNYQYGRLVPDWQKEDEDTSARAYGRKKTDTPK
jgi:hypothetical protein